ncbi:hypothetical protein BGX24_006681 [Mortierella sp. AD032]|nr:hypothetical protein BGX24_006681 [Mortierella sp. AD032]
MDIINLEPNDATQVLDYGPNSRASGSFTPALTTTPTYNSNDSTLSGSISSASSGSTSSAPKARQPSKKSALSTTSVQRNPTSSNRKRDHSATSAALVITGNEDEGEADEADRNDNESEDQEGGSGSAAKFIWGEKEMQFLVDWWKVPYNYHKLKNPSDYRYQTTKQAIYKELASLMAKDGYAVTSKQIENKMFAMMAAYKEAKKILNKTGAGDKDGKTLSEQIEDVCSFFDAVHPVWDGDMNTDPINIRSTVSSERRGVGTGGHATGAVGSSVWELDGLPQESSRPIREGTGAATNRAKPLDKAQNQNGLLDGIQKLGNRTNETYMKMEETKQPIAKEEARVQIEKVQLDKLEIQMRMARQEKDRVDDRQIQHHRSQQQKWEHEVQILAQKAKAKLETEAEVTRRTALKLEIAREIRQQEEMKLKNEQETLRLKIELKKLEMELLAKGKKDE